MILGQSAATLASMAVDEGKTIYEIPFEKLKAKLLKEGQVLEYTK